MFEYQPRRHPLQTFQFWFALLICAIGVTLWRSGVFSNTSDPVENIPVVLEEDLPPPPVNADRDAGEDAPLYSEVDMAPQQGEEGIERIPQPVESFASEPSTVTPDRQTSAIPVQSGLKVRSESNAVLPISAQGNHERSHLQTADLNSSQKVTDIPERHGVSDQDLAEVQRLIEDGQDVQALRLLSTWYWQQPEMRSRIRRQMDLLSRRIYLQPHPHYMEPYTVQFGDRLETIAKKYNVSWEYLAKINRVQAEKIRAGQKLKVIQGPFSVIVDLSDYELTVHAHGYYVVRMPVGIGKDESTPIGTFRVTDKVVDPIYYGPDGVIQNDDPSNPLGERWIAISDESGTLQGYGLHGTIDPQSIGQSESRGCVRLHDQDIADLYDLLTIGSEVVIRR